MDVYQRAWESEVCRYDCSKQPPCSLFGRISGGKSIPGTHGSPLHEYYLLSNDSTRLGGRSPSGSQQRDFTSSARGGNCFAQLYDIEWEVYFANSQCQPANPKGRHGPVGAGGASYRNAKNCARLSPICLNLR